jgi:glyoxylase-like metal-dependent hydrolase (beta-lactamase superfamily II)
MDEEISFDRSFEPAYGIVEEVVPGIRRIVAPNPGPFTFTGTNTFIVGHGEVALIDPGPRDESHRQSVEHALSGERLSAIIVTHTHHDHSPLARPVSEAHGATVYGFGQHRPARPPRPGEATPLDGAGDMDFKPDTILADGDTVRGPDWSLTVLHTPGHTANHICLQLDGTGILFSGDHVMAWSTTVVAPPDGSMADYMASLKRLLTRDDTLYLPAHGGAVERPRRFVRALLSHRRQREAAILKRLRAGDDSIPQIVSQIYQGLDPRLRTAAGLSVLAHIEEMVLRGTVLCDGPPRLEARFWPS